MRFALCRNQRPCSGDVHLTGTPLRPGSGSTSTTAENTTSESSSTGEWGDTSGFSLLVEAMPNSGYLIFKSFCRSKLIQPIGA